MRKLIVCFVGNAGQISAVVQFSAMLAEAQAIMAFFILNVGKNIFWKTHHNFQCNFLTPIPN
jgi:hypothetical protein